METPSKKPRYIFICRQGVFRSQVAKALCETMSGNKVSAEAYGTVVAHQGTEGKAIVAFSGMADIAQMLLGDGVDITKARCAQVTPEHVRGADKICVLSEKELVPKWLEEYPYEYWDIQNPPELTPDFARETIEKIKGKVATLVADMEVK